MNKSLEQEISSWDGKSSSDISAIYSRYKDGNNFVPQFVKFSKQKTLQKGATWLLKHHLQNGGKIDSNQISKMYKLLSQLNHWETKLLVLQCIPYMPIAKAEKESVEIFLRECLMDSNKFVRAWAYNGFYEISCQYPEYKNETMQFFEMAMKDEAPSVKARIRNILKKGVLTSQCS